MISPETIEEIKNRADIVDVVGDFVDLKKSGSSYKALSPFTSEKSPSFFVVPSKGIFKCFSSGKGGDSITFLMELDGISYVEALKYLANKYGIEIQEDEQKTDEQLAAQNKRESLYIVLNYAARTFHDLLHQNEEGKSIGLSYFKERGFSEETIEDFELGYSLDQWDYLHKDALSKGYNEEILEQAGLIVKKDENKVYDRFRGRVIFPIHNLTGKVIAFGARILKTDKKQPKYLNSPESELYHKSKVLYGLFQAKQEIKKEDKCYIVEGYTDVISLHQLGIKNVVSSSGTALTGEQAKLIKRYTQNVTVVFDGDAAGTRASLRGIDILIEEGLDVQAVHLPDGEDPDSYSQKLGTTAFQHYLQSEALDFIRFKTKMLLQETENDPIKKAEVIREILLSVAKIGDSIKRELYVKECSNLLEVEERSLFNELNKILQNNAKTRQKAELRQQQASDQQTVETEAVQKSEAPRVDAEEVSERKIIQLLLKYGAHTIKNEEDDEMYIIEYILNEITDVQFSSPIYRQILQVVKERFEEGLATDHQFFINNDNEQVKSEVVSLSTSRYEVSEFWNTRYQIYVPSEEDLLKDVTFSDILLLKYRKIDKELNAVSERIKIASADELDAVLDEYSELKSIKIEIAKILGIVIS